MSRFREEMKVIPLPAWVIAGILYVVMAGWLLLMTRGAGVEEVLPGWGRLLLVLGAPLVVSCYNLLAGYVYGDSKRRGMRHIMWTLLAIFIPNAIGFILYFILREPIQLGCIQCGARLNAGFPFCPACGAAQAPSCPACHRSIQPGWSHCAHCGARLK